MEKEEAKDIKRKELTVFASIGLAIMVLGTIAGIIAVSPILFVILLVIGSVIYQFANADYGYYNLRKIPSQDLSKNKP